MNNVILIGRTTSDIELKQTQTGKSVTTFSIAVSRPHTKDQTDFFTIVAWEKLAELISRYVRKGNLICVRGYLTTRKWQAPDGSNRHAVELVAEDIKFLESKKEADADTSSTVGYATAPATPQFEELKEDDDLPF